MEVASLFMEMNRLHEHHWKRDNLEDSKYTLLGSDDRRESWGLIGHWIYKEAEHNDTGLLQTRQWYVWNENQPCTMMPSDCRLPRASHLAKHLNPRW